MSNTNITKNFLQEMMNMSDVDFRLHRANATRSTKSFSMIYSDSGKRLTISKALAAHLDLNDKACLFPLVNSGVLILAKELPKGKCLEVNLSGKDKKTAYNAAVVEYLVNQFKIDYTDCSSKSFTDITFEQDGDAEIAAIKLAPPIVTSETAESTADEGDAEDENS